MEQDAPFTLWVDADGVPRAVREVVVRAAAKRQLRVVLVANRYLERPVTRFVEVVQVARARTARTTTSPSGHNPETS